MIRILLGIGLMGVSVVMLFMFIGDPEDNDLVQQIQSSLHCQPGETFTQELGRYVDNFGTSTDGYELAFYCEDSEGEQRDVTGAGVVTIGAAFVVPFVLGLLMMLWGIFAMVWKATRKLTSAALNAANSGFGQGQFGDSSGFGQGGVQPSGMYTSTTGQPVQGSASYIMVNGQQVEASSLPPEQLQKIQQALSSLGMNVPITGATSGISSMGSVPSTGSASTDLVAQLQQLEDARNQSLITQEEYDRMRKEILDRLT